MDNCDITEQLEKLTLKDQKSINKCMKKVGYIYDPRMLLHRCCQQHVEKPERIMSIHNNLLDKSLMEFLEELQTDYINDDKLLMVHTKSHIEKVENLKFERDKRTPRGENESNYTLCSDTYDNYASANAARISANSTTIAVDKVMSNLINGAFLAIRPPGHHASSEEVSGFCFYNNVAIGAMHAIKNHNLKRVAIVDWDVHHGNGTQKIFYDSKEILFISIHRYDNKKFYPQQDGNYTDIGGKEEAKGYNLNIPWNTSGGQSNIGDDEYLYAFDTIVIPILKEFKPELVFVSCGFDAAEGDPLGKLSLTPLGYACMTEKLKELMEDKLIVVLEGGYNLQSIAKCSEAIIRTLIGMKAPFTNERKKEAFSLDELKKCYRASYPCIRAINLYKEYFEKYWKNLKDVKVNQLKVAQPFEKDNYQSLEILNKLFTDKNISINKFLLSDSREFQNYDFLIFKIGRSTYLNKERLEKYNKHLRIALRTGSYQKGYRIEGVKIQGGKLNWYKYDGNLEIVEDEDWKTLALFFKGISKKKSFLESVKEIISQAEILMGIGYDLIGLNLCLIKTDKKEIIVKLNCIKGYSIVNSSNTNIFLEGIKNLLKFLEENII